MAFNAARTTFEKIMGQIEEFEETIDDDKEIAVILASFGSEILLSVTEMGYEYPDLIYFYGYTEGGKPAQLIQHVSQLNFLLTAVDKENPEEPPRRIGFLTESEEAKKLEVQK